MALAMGFFLEQTPLLEMSWLLKGTLLVDNPQPLAKASAGNMPSEIAPRRGVGEHGSETVEQACCNISW